MADTIKVDIRGLEELKRAIEKYPKEAARYLSAAGKEAAKKVVLDTKGLKRYPEETAANFPPTPYYIRGRGMQRAGRRKPEYNDLKSKNLGKQWYIKGEGYNVVIGNETPYAHWVHGEDQASFMAPKGWRKLSDVVKEKINEIEVIYQRWVDKLLVDIGLK